LGTGEVLASDTDSLLQPDRSEDAYTVTLAVAGAVVPDIFTSNANIV
jgi:hypothetical protein